MQVQERPVAANAGGGPKCDNGAPIEDTGLTKAQKDEIRRTWAVVSTMKTKFGVDIFVNLFTECKGAQDYFVQLKDMKDMAVLRKSAKMKAHAYRVVTAFSNFVENLDTPDVFIELLKNTGIAHGNRHVPHIYFEQLGPIFLNTMADNLGEHFTPAAKEAWGTAYGYMVKVIFAAMEGVE